MTRALFLRHGESVSNADQSTLSLPEEVGDRLTERGHEQAAAAARALADTGITRLLSSPMRRATETAEVLEMALELPVTVVPHIHELRFPDESFDQVVARVRKLKGELEARPDGELPLIVSHGIFIRFFLLDSLLGEEFGPSLLGPMWNLRSVNCGVSTFERGERWNPADVSTPGWTCISWMSRPWDPP